MSYLTFGDSGNDDGDKKQSHQTSDNEAVIRSNSNAIASENFSLNKTEIDRLIANIDDSIKLAGKNERHLRRSAVSIEMNESEGLDFDYIRRIVFNSLTFKQLSSAQVYYWSDDKFTSAYFHSEKLRNRFIELVEHSTDSPLRGKIKEANENGERITRKPVPIEIQDNANGREHEELRTYIESLLQSNGDGSRVDSAVVSNESCRAKNGIIAIKIGGQNNLGVTGVGHKLVLAVNAAGFRDILSKFGDRIQYLPFPRGTESLRTACISERGSIRLMIRFGSWMCATCCSVYKRHDCPGVICIKCGRSNNHSTNDCPSMESFCRNCHERGHMVTDLNCPQYISKLIHELRQLDIPLEYYEDEKLRSILVKLVIVSLMGPFD